MPGMFDDLIPKDQPASGGMFDDLIPVAQKKPGIGLHTLAEPIKGLGGSFNAAAAALNTVAGGVPVIADKIGQAVGYNAPGEMPASDWWFGNTVKPLLDRQHYFDPEGGQNANIVDKALNATGGVAGMMSQALLTPEVEVPAVLARGMSAVAPAAKDAITTALVRGGSQMAVPATTSGVNTARDVYQATNDPVKAAGAGVAVGAQNAAMGVMPMGAAGAPLKRVVTGAATMPVVNAGLTEGIVNPAMPANMQSETPFTAAEKAYQQTGSIADAFMAGLEHAAPDMILGGAMHGAMGHGAPTPMQSPAAIAAMRAKHNAENWGINRADGYGPDGLFTPEAAPAAEPLGNPFLKPLPEATKEMNDRLFPVGNDAPNAPPLTLVEKGGKAEKFESRSNPDPASINSHGMTLEGDGANRVLADSDLRNITKVLGLSEQDVLAMPRHAQEALRDHANSFAESTGAFDIAARRQRQADADLANHGELAPDYQASGAAASGGEFDSGIRRITLLDKQLPIEVLSNDGNVADIRYQDGNGEWTRMQVEAKRLSEHAVPQNQRLAQDFRDRGYFPPDGVGERTMEDEHMPPFSTDRITGDRRSGRTTPYNPNEINRGPLEGTVERPGEGGLPPPKNGPRRQGETFDQYPTREPGTSVSTVDGEGVRRPYDNTFAAGDQRRLEGQSSNGALPSPEHPMPGRMTAGSDGVRPTTYGENEVRQRSDFGAWRDSVGRQEGSQPAQKETSAQNHADVQQERDPWLDHQNKNTPEQKPVTDTPKAELSSGSRLLADIKKDGGIDPKEAVDLTGDNAFNAGKRMRGVFKKGGMSADGALEWMKERGWLNQDATIDDARALLRESFDRESQKVFKADGSDIEARAAAEADRAWQVHQERMASDPEYRAEQERLDRETMAEEGLADNRRNTIDHDKVAQAYAADEAAVERAAVKYENDDAAFMREIERIIDDQHAKQSAEAKDTGDATVQRGEEDGAAREKAAGSEDFTLESHDDAELRARDERQRAADRAESDRQRELEKKSEADAALDDFLLTGSERKADANPNQGDLLSGKSESAVDKKKREGAGTLSMNPMFDPKLIVKAVHALFGSAFEIKGEFGLHARDAKEAWSAAFGGDNPIRRFASKVFNTSAGAQRRIADRLNSDTMRWVVDQFQTEAGSSRVTGETFDAAVDRFMHDYQTRVKDALGDMVNDDVAMRAVANRVRAGNFDGTPIGRAARQIADILKDAHNYMKEAGVEVGEVKDGYYPREFDIEAILKNPNDFIRAITAEYKRQFGMNDADAKDGAVRLYSTLVDGDQGSMFNANGGAIRSPWAKERVFDKKVDQTLEKYLKSDPGTDIMVYLQKVARRAEIARRFGDRFAHWSEDYTDANGKKQQSILSRIEAEGGQSGIEPLKNFVALAAGLRSAGVDKDWVRSASMVRTWTTLAVLEKATLSSLTEFITPAIRASGSRTIGGVHVPGAVIIDAAMNLKNTVADLVMKNAGKDAASRRAFAEDLHLIASEMNDTLMAARFSGGEPVSKMESRITAKYFRRIGLTQWTEATRVAAVHQGRVFIRRLAVEAADGDRIAARHLRELGVPEARMAEFADAVKNTNDGMPTAMSLAGMGDIGVLYRNGVSRFLEQSIMNPRRTTKPAWMSHPVGAVVGQLQAYNYAFYENVWKRNASLAKEGITGKGDNGEQWSAADRARLLAPMLSMPLLVAAAYAVGELRDEYLGDPNKRTQETNEQKWIKAASRGAPIAPLDPWVNMLSNARYNASSINTMAGPAFGTVGKGLDAAVAMIRDDDATNSNERKAAQAVYDLMIEPTANALLSVLPVKPAAAAATQVIGAGATRESFVSAVAGKNEKVEKDKKSMEILGRDRFFEIQDAKKDEKRRKDEMKRNLAGALQ